MAWIEVRRGELCLHLGLPEVRPALERRALEQVGAVADRVDIGPGADVIGTDLRLLNQVPRVRHLAEIELLVQAVVRIKPTDVRGREGDVALRIALGELLLVQPIDGAAGDVFNRRAGVGGKLLGDNIGDHIAPAAAPYADDQLVLSRGLYRRQQQTQGAECRAKPLHAAISPLSPRAGGLAGTRTTPVHIRRAIIRSEHGACPAWPPPADRPGIAPV